MGEMRVNIVDEGLVTRLVDLARTNNRSVDREVEELLQAALSAHPRREDLPAIAARIAAMTPKGIRQTDSVELLREIRGN